MLPRRAHLRSRQRRSRATGSALTAAAARRAASHPGMSARRDSRRLPPDRNTMPRGRVATTAHPGGVRRSPEQGRRAARDMGRKRSRDTARDRRMRRIHSRRPGRRSRGASLRRATRHHAIPLLRRRASRLHGRHRHDLHRSAHPLRVRTRAWPPTYRRRRRRRGQRSRRTRMYASWHHPSRRPGGADIGET